MDDNERIYIEETKKQIDAFIDFIIKELDEIDSRPNCEGLKIIGLKRMLEGNNNENNS